MPYRKNLRHAITVIVPVYNSQTTLKRCIDSVTSQTFSSFELLLIDDGSVDSSYKICLEAAQHDDRIKVMYQENAGVSMARNAGIEAADGKFVFFLDADDALYPEALQEYILLADKYQCDAVLGSLDIITEHGTKRAGFPTEKVYGVEIWEEICKNSRAFGWAGAKMFRRDVIRGIRFNKNMISQEDLDFNLESYKLCERILCSSYAGYQYYYAESQREPRVFDYINNQIKLLTYAEEKTTISDMARTCVLSRISKYIYVLLYNSGSRKDYADLAKQVKAVHNIQQFSGEFKRLHIIHSSMIEQTIKGQYLPGFMYTSVRRVLGKIYRYMTNKQHD